MEGANKNGPGAGPSAELTAAANAAYEGALLRKADQEKQAEPVVPFEQSGIEEQIRRLRLELIMVRELAQSQQQLIERLMVHSHAGSEIAVPMRYSGGMASGYQRRQDRLA